MFRPRVIPVLLLEHAGLVKTQRFGDARYVGDPINAVKIFNDFYVDELVVLDILATKEKRSISPEFVRSVGEEANMPFAAGGGIRTLRAIREVLAAGAEKVVIGAYAAENPDFVEEASNQFGASTIVVCIDVKKSWRGKSLVWTVNGTKATSYEPIDFARLMQTKGAGEIIIQSIDRDGMMMGYDTDLITTISPAVEIPVIALGGAGELQHLRDAYAVGASALAAGSFFVFHGQKRGVLISYPAKTTEMSWRR